MSETLIDARWNCQIDTLGADQKPKGPPQKPLTVGEKFLLTCGGDSVVLAKETLTLRLPKSEKYALRLLTIKELEPNRAQFVATSYLVAEGQLQGALLTDGSRFVALDGVELNLTSVIDPQQNPEGKPYAPPDPSGLAWPLWFWISIAIALLLIAAFALWRLVKRIQRRRFLRELDSNRTSLSPYNQLQKDLRALTRQYALGEAKSWSETQAESFANELNSAFRWYLAREFRVPALTWSDSSIVSGVKKQKRHLSQDSLKNLRLVLRELKQAKANSKKLKVFDGSQIHEMARRVSDEIELADANRERRL